MVKVTKLYGNQDTVSFYPGEKGTELLFKSKPNSIIMLHNHPGQSGFSLNDIFIYKVKFYQKYNNSYKLWKTKYLTKR